MDLLLGAEPSSVTLSVSSLAMYYFPGKFVQDGLSRSLLTEAVLQ